MESEKVTGFQSIAENVGQFNLTGKTVLMPEMSRAGTHLLAAVFRGFGIKAKVMETYKGLDLGKEYTSGKECYPCQVTLGDILYFIKKEKERLKDNFNAKDYLYFMPEAEGPCRFGMYNKYQRIVLDSFPGLEKLKIGSISSENSYDFTGMIEQDRVKNLRKAAFLSVVVADIIERLLWRIRPYEKETGTADAFIEKSIYLIGDAFESYVAKKEVEKILDVLDDVIREGKMIIDPSAPPRPMIGIVGEIYLRNHVHANQDLIRVLESYGAEVVNASTAEWVNYIAYSGLRDAAIKFRLSLKQLKIGSSWEFCKKIIGFGKEFYYQQYIQKKCYRRARAIIDISEDHKIAHLEKILKEKDLFSFDIGTEACLSIPGIVSYAQDGYNGIVNVYPFGCMPGTITSSIAKPLISTRQIPYMDTAYDESFQPGRETEIRTFMYQAYQHFKRHGRKRH